MIKKKALGERNYKKLLKKNGPEYALEKLEVALAKERTQREKELSTGIQYSICS